MGKNFRRTGRNWGQRWLAFHLHAATWGRSRWGFRHCPRGSVNGSEPKCWHESTWPRRKETRSHWHVQQAIIKKSTRNHQNVFLQTSIFGDSRPPCVPKLRENRSAHPKFSAQPTKLGLQRQIVFQTPVIAFLSDSVKLNLEVLVAPWIVLTWPKLANNADQTLDHCRSWNLFQVSKA